MTATEIVEACQELAERGWVANHDGNISIRRPRDGFLVTPTAFRKRDVRAVDLLVIDDDGAVRQGRHRVFSEWQLHRSVYQARSDARAVVHAHPPFATSMAAQVARLDPSFMAEALVSLGPEIGWVPFEKPGATALGLAVQSVSQRCHAALLGQHGVLAWGSDLTMAMCRLELVEQLARIVVTSAPLGGVKSLPQPVVRQLVEKHVGAGLAAPGVKL